MDLEKMQNFVDGFARERDWDKFHIPKNLVMALAGESGELLELFQWLTPEESRDVMKSESSGKKVRDELADIFIYTMRIADKLNIDLEKAFWEKMQQNADKYPVHLAKGHATKYTDLEE